MDELLSFYTKISENEKITGEFSEKTVMEYRSYVLENYFINLKAALKRRSLVYIGTYLCFAAIEVGLIAEGGKPIFLLPALIMWTLAFITNSFAPLLVDWPSAKRCRRDLRLAWDTYNSPSKTLEV